MIFFFRFSLILAVFELIISRGDSDLFCKVAAGLFVLSLYFSDIVLNNTNYAFINRHIFAGRYVRTILAIVSIGPVFLTTYEQYTTYLFVLSIAALILILFSQPESKAHRVNRNIPGSWFILTVSALLAFSIAAALDLKEYYALSGEMYPSLDYGDLSNLLALVFILVWVSLKYRDNNLNFILSLVSCLCSGAFVAVTLLTREEFIWPQLSQIDINQMRKVTIALLIVVSFLAFFGAQSKGLFARYKFSSIFSIVTLGFVVSSVLFCSKFLRETLTDSEIVPYRVSAKFVIPLLVAEDPRFMRHAGVDYHRLRQVMSETIHSGEIKRGGSTIPMQLAKVRFLGHQKTFMRKVNQIFLAYLLELNYSKEEILFAYLESIPYGPGLIGLKATTNQLFSIDPGYLSSEQALKLVLSIFDPNYYNLSMTQMPKEIYQRGIVIAGRTKAFRSVLSAELRQLQHVNFH